MAKKRMAKANHEPKQKAIAYQLILQHSDDGAPLYERLYTIIDTHHEEISHASVRVALAWAKSWKPDVDGRLTLGKCKKATDLDRELAPFDFVILLNRDWWLHPRTTEAQRAAVLDHECCHMAIAIDKETGEPLYDDRGRNVFRIRKHSIEEFTEIVDRHGIYKNDVESFASAVHRAERSTGSEWIGYTKLRDTLRSIGVTLDVAVIATWSDDERREVMTWALLRQDDTVGKKADVISLSQTVPAVPSRGARDRETRGTAGRGRALRTP
jgi:hypothetical protein